MTDSQEYPHSAFGHRVEPDVAEQFVAILRRDEVQVAVERFEHATNLRAPDEKFEGHLSSLQLESTGPPVQCRIRGTSGTALQRCSGRLRGRTCVRTLCSGTGIL